MRHGPPTLAGRLRRLVRRRRRLIAALLLCAAAAVAVQQLTPSAATTATVLTAAADLPAGHTLAETDLVPAAVGPAMVPDGALEGAGAWVGRQLSGPVRRGEVVTDASLLGRELLVGAPPGSQAVPLRLADPSTVQLLHQGQRVDVVLSAATGAGAAAGLDGPNRNEVLARSVSVLWTSAMAPAATTLVPSQEADGLVVVAAAAEDAASLAGASARGKVFLVLVP